MPLGSWADWVSGGATALTFFLALQLLFRDRRKEARSEAAKVVTWATNLDVDGALEVEVAVINGGERPVHNLSIHIPVPDEPGEEAKAYFFELGSVLRPGVEISCRYPFAKFRANGNRPSYIRFMDSAGIYWLRDIRTAKLRRARDPLSFRWSHFFGTVRRRKGLRYLRATLARRSLPRR